MPKWLPWYPACPEHPLPPPQEKGTLSPFLYKESSSAMVPCGPTWSSGSGATELHWDGPPPSLFLLPSITPSCPFLRNSFPPCSRNLPLLLSSPHLSLSHPVVRTTTVSGGKSSRMEVQCQRWPSMG